MLSLSHMSTMYGMYSDSCRLRDEISLGTRTLTVFKNNETLKPSYRNNQKVTQFRFIDLSFGQVK